MMHIRNTNSRKDLQGILDLQAVNLRQTKSPDVEQEQGFVTVRHDLEILQMMHHVAPHIIALEDEKVIAYALAMDKEFGDKIPELLAMFEMLDSLRFNGQSVKEINYLVMGQVCVDEIYRGQGVFSALYNYYFEYFKSKYDFVITEIAERNTRSLRAHSKVGFEAIHTYHEEGMENWVVVIRKL